MSKWTLIIKQKSEYGYGWKESSFESESITALVHIIDAFKASDITPTLETLFAIEEVEEADDDVDE